MSEGYLLKAPPLNVECYQLTVVDEPQNRLPPDFPQIESDLKPASVPKGTLGQPLSYHDLSEREQKGTPLIPGLGDDHTQMRHK